VPIRCRRPTRIATGIDGDALLMLSAGQGNVSAMETLVRKHRGGVRFYVYRMVRDYSVSEDLAQDVFLKVHRYRKGYRVTARFTTWLYRIAEHVALNWLRDNARSRANEPLESTRGDDFNPRQLQDVTPRVDELLMQQVLRREVRQAVNRLPERQRAVVVLHKFDGLRCEEIARRLGCSHQAVRSLLCRAYATLRESLATAR